MGKLNSIVIFAIFFLPGCSGKKHAKAPAPTRDFQAGEYYDYYGVRDSAFYFYNRVVNNSSDSIEKGTAYFKMGLRQLEAGDYYSAQESLLLSIKTLDEKDSAHFNHISASYNTLANATLALKDYEAALQNYNMAFRFASEGDPKLYILNNLGVAYQKKADYKKALIMLDSAMDLPTADTFLKARLISNSARTKWLADSNFYALPEFMAALRLRLMTNDSFGMNASFSHLSDYYSISNPDSALQYALKRFQIAEKIGEPNNTLEAISQVARLSRPSETKSYLEKYMHLDDSLGQVRSKDRNQYVLIKFDAEKSKADNLILQRNVARQRLVFGIVMLCAIIIILGLYFFFRARRRRIKRDSENAIRESKLKTSQKVHDIVANGLYRIMNELEHKESIERTELLNRIEWLYERSRDISYEDQTSENNSAMHVQQLVSAYANDSTDVIIVGDQKLLWDSLTAFQKTELELVMEELLVNMQKHSKATKATFRFRKGIEDGYIEYRDNGIGFGPALQHGNGLNNTVNRIRSIGGRINFENSIEGGAVISISFPLNPSNND